MGGQAVLLICILVPLLGAFLLPVMGRFNQGLRNIAALIFVLISFIMSIIALFSSLAGNPLQLHVEMPLGFSIGFYADSLAVYTAMISALVVSIIIFYSFGYMEEHCNQNEYYMLVVLFVGTIMGLIYSSDLILIYMFWLLSSVCCWRLISFSDSSKAAYYSSKAFLINMAGSLVMLIGFIGIYIKSGSFDLLYLQGRGLDNGLVMLILCGILSKAALLPFHVWLPDASSAPAPVSALLNTVAIVGTGVYVYARLFLANFQLEPVWESAIPIICTVSALVCAGAAMRENDIRRITAYAAISQTACVLIGFSCSTMLGTAGSLLYILMHYLGIGGLSLCVGIIEQRTGCSDIRLLGGLKRNLPLTTFALVLCALSVISIPPFGGFFAKYMMLSGIVQSGQLWLAACLVLCSVLTVFYLLRLYVKLFFGDITHPDLQEGSWEMVSAVVVLGLLVLLFGIAINVPANIVTVAIESLGRW